MTGFSHSDGDMLHPDRNCLSFAEELVSDTMGVQRLGGVSSWKHRPLEVGQKVTGESQAKEISVRLWVSRSC